MKNTYQILISLTVFMSTACKENIRDGHQEDMQKALSECIQSHLDNGLNVIAGMASLSRVGTPEKPVSVLLTWHSDKERYEDYSYNADRMPVFPSGIMQTATLAYYLDKGIIAVNDSVITNHGILPEMEDVAGYQRYDPHILDYERETGQDRMSIHDGFLKSLRYVTDRYVLDNMDAAYYYNNLFIGFTDQLIDYFGPSEAYYIPNYRYQGILKKPALSIADGTGVLLSQWQMLNFYGSIANNGVNPRRNHGMKKRIVSEKTAKTIQTLLRDNVLEGTGVLVKDCVIPVAGKTGNGVVDKGRIPGYGLLEEKGAIRSSTFVGYFPADAPKYTMCVTYYYKDVFSYTLSSLTFKEIVNRLNQEGLL